MVRGFRHIKMGRAMQQNYYGPSTPGSDKVHEMKYRGKGETFREAMTRVASALQDSEDHFVNFRDCLLNMRFLPAGRIQIAVGTSRGLTPYNCYVSGTIADSFVDGASCIMDRAKEAASTMRLGGGIGYDFSTLRPRGALIKKLNSKSSGAVSFMGIFNEVCLSTASSGHRRGAQMGVLRVDHPDIEEFVRAKQNTHRLTGFNISVAITDDFMRAMQKNEEFPLTFEGQVYSTINARHLWELIMRSTYDWAEPGVLFIDNINKRNNLHYCERIAATNPCGEQPLPPYGACLLGSFNLPKYLKQEKLGGPYSFNWQRLSLDIPHVVRAMDNVVDRARYPLHEQEQEARRKRRMGLGVTGAANAIEALGPDFRYGSESFIHQLTLVLNFIRNEAYRASSALAAEKGPFPLYSRDYYLAADTPQQLSQDVQDSIYANGIRNSHLLSIAPTGTISLCADNVSSGIEPVFSYHQRRVLMEEHGPVEYQFEDYGHKFLGVEGRTTEDCTIEDHLKVLVCASHRVDSAVSKTCNVPQNIDWQEFKSIYEKAWEAGCKGCTTYRKGGMREAILTDADETANQDNAELEGSSCEIDPVTGVRSCE